MADFMISYSSSDRAIASGIIGFLREHGKTLWLDEAPDRSNDELVGVPGGQEHWRTIETAIDEAGAFLVLETPAWHASAYCNRELEHARTVGKRVVVAVPGSAESQVTDTAAAGPLENLSWLLPALRVGDDAAAAHARLVRDMSSVRPKRKVNGFGREVVGDATLVSTSSVADFGLSISPEMAEYCQRVFLRRRSRRRVGGALAAVVLLLLGLLGTATVLASGRAQQDNAAAEQAENRSLALLTAQRAEQALTTHDRLVFARQAISYADTPATRATLAWIEQIAGYLTTVQSPANPTKFGAVSDDGHTVLIGRANSVLVVSPGAGTFKSAEVPEGLGHRVAMSADGRTAYAVTTTGNLLCIDVPTATVRRSSMQKVVDVDLSGDGTLLVLTQNAQLSTVPSCDGSPTVIGAGFNTVQEITVDVADQLLLTLTTDDHVVAYRLPHGHQSTTPRLLWNIAMLTVPLADGHDAGTPNTKVPGYLTICGHTIHAVAGVAYSLTSSTHVAVSPAGEVIGSRISNIAMTAVGCGPDGTAWASPWINARPLGLSDRGYYPIGVVDSRDRGSANTVAASPNGKWAVVAHADGRVDVVDTTQVPWGQSVGKAIIAVPVAHGIITGDSMGNMTFRTRLTTSSLGKVPGELIPWTVALNSEAIVAAGKSVYRIDRAGVHRLWTAPEAVTTVNSGSGGTDVVVETDSGVTAVPLSGDRPVSLITPPPQKGEKYFTAALDGKAVLWTTNFGRLVLADASGKIAASVDTGVAGRILAVFRPDHGVVAIGGDGVLRTYSVGLKPLGGNLFGSAAAVLRPTPDGRVAILGMTDYSVWAIDTTTLTVVAKVQDRSTDMRLIVPSADGRTADSLITNTDSHQLEELSLPSATISSSGASPSRSGGTSQDSGLVALSSAAATTSTAPSSGGREPAKSSDRTNIASSTTSMRIGPDKFGPFILGMTIAEAEKVYPGLKRTKTGASSMSCSSAAYLGASLVFGKKGTLVFVRQGDHPVPAANGLKVGDTLGKVRSLYPDAAPSENDPNLVIPTAPGSKFAYWIDLRFDPHFEDPNFKVPATATIRSIDLDFNQNCFD